MPDIRRMSGQLGQGVGALGAGIAEKYRQGQLSPEARMRERIDKSILNDIDAFLAEIRGIPGHWQTQKIEEFRTKMKGKGADVNMLLDYYLTGTGGAELTGGPGIGAAPALTMENWPATEKAKTDVQALVQGRRPGFEQELAMQNLPPGEREAALAKRFQTSGIEARYKGAEEVARSMIDWQAKAGMATGRERALARSQQGKGTWEFAPEDLFEEFKKTRPGMWPEEKVARVTEYEKSGRISPEDAEWIRMVAQDKPAPDWAMNLPKALYPAMGLKQGPQGTPVLDFENKGVQETVDLINVMLIFDQMEMSIGEIQKLDRYELLTYLAFGSGMIPEVQWKEMDAGKSKEYTKAMVDQIKEPIGPALSALDERTALGFLESIKELLALGLTIDEAAGVLSLARSSLFRES